MNEQIDTTQAALLQRFSAWLVGGFAVMALALGVVGLYGVIAYSVSQRTREIGAAQFGVRLIMWQAGWLTAAGLAIGLVCSVGASLLMGNLLFGVRAWDAATLGCVAVLLGLTSMAASFLPARRAASVNPTDALRAE
jgi:macrolide transport system ATP-binding/permease protein